MVYGLEADAEGLGDTDTDALGELDGVRVGLEVGVGLTDGDELGEVVADGVVDGVADGVLEGERDGLAGAELPWAGPTRFGGWTAW